MREALGHLFTELINCEKESEGIRLRVYEKREAFSGVIREALGLYPQTKDHLSEGDIAELLGEEGTTEARLLVRKYDRNHDGVVSFDEVPLCHNIIGS